MCPVTFESGSSTGFSMLRLAKAFSPKMDLQEGRRINKATGAGMDDEVDLLGIHIGGHEATLAGERLLWRQALHVGALQEMLEILVQIGEASVHSDLVLPLKVLPHLTEFGVCAAGRDDVIHDVNVDGVQHHNIGVQRGVVNCKEEVE